MKKYYDLYFHDSGSPLTYNPFLPPPKKPEKPRDYFTLAFWCLMILGVMGVCYGSYEVGREVGKKEERERTIRQLTENRAKIDSIQNWVDSTKNHKK